MRCLPEITVEIDQNVDVLVMNSLHRFTVGELGNGDEFVECRFQSPAQGTVVAPAIVECHKLETAFVMPLIKSGGQEGGCLLAKFSGENPSRIFEFRDFFLIASDGAGG